MREEQQQKQFPRRSIFSSSSTSDPSTASLKIEGNGLKTRIQRLIVQCVQKASLRKPIDTDSELHRSSVSHSSFFLPGRTHLTWLLFVALAYLYNFISIPLRIAFPIWRNGETPIWVWMIVDYSCDLLYVLDMCFVQTRIKYLENGLWVVSDERCSRPGHPSAQSSSRPGFA